MGGDTERIEREIVQAREDLAKTLDALAERTSPQRLADDAKTKAVALVNKPAVKYGLAAVGVVAVLVVIRSIAK